MMKMICLIATAMLGVTTHAEVGMQARATTPMRDPYLPPVARQAKLASATTGDALHAQVMAKLQRQFMAADMVGSGTITAEQSKRGGMGFVAEHFKEIDVAGRGSVSFEQVRRYLQQHAPR
ncbi:MAG: EF-hand domain-containing protein [Burkholderiales bacterium]|nr:EF-hand domain-containing protein [Burkholderiales bacterium]